MNENSSCGLMRQRQGAQHVLDLESGSAWVVAVYCCASARLNVIWASQCQHGYRAAHFHFPLTMFLFFPSCLSSGSAIFPLWLGRGPAQELVCDYRCPELLKWRWTSCSHVSAVWRPLVRHCRRCHALQAAWFQAIDPAVVQHW